MMGGLLHLVQQRGAPPSPLIAVPNVTAHPSTASVPTSYYSMWHYNSSRAHERVKQCKLVHLSYELLTTSRDIYEYEIRLTIGMATEMAFQRMKKCLLLLESVWQEDFAHGIVTSGQSRCVDVECIYRIWLRYYKPMECGCNDTDIVDLVRQ